MVLLRLLLVRKGRTSSPVLFQNHDVVSMITDSTSHIPDRNPVLFLSIVLNCITYFLLSCAFMVHPSLTALNDTPYPTPEEGVEPNPVAGREDVGLNPVPASGVDQE